MAGNQQSVAVPFKTKDKLMYFVCFRKWGCQKRYWPYFRFYYQIKTFTGMNIHFLVYMQSVIKKHFIENMFIAQKFNKKVYLSSVDLGKAKQSGHTVHCLSLERTHGCEINKL